MPTFAPIERRLPANAGVKTRLKVVLLHIACGSLALYPLLEQFIAAVLGASLLLIAVSSLFGLLNRRLVVRQSFIWTVWILLAGVYLIWFCIGVLNQNIMKHITQDSLGFLLYLVVLPVVYLFIVQNGLQGSFYRFVERVSLLIASVSVALTVVMFLIFGEINTPMILGVNAFLSGLSLSWKISHNSGVIGLYTNAAHFLLLGSALALYRYSFAGHRRDAFLILLYLAGMFLDGRRALVIAALLQLLIMLPKLMKRLTPQRRLTFVVGGLAVLVMLIGANLDWIQQRFEFSEEDISSAERYAQIPALLDKISESPLIGSGFGTVASYIRSDERPFSYEVDFLATLMKLGAIGSLLYFGAYLYGMAQSLRINGTLGRCLLSAGFAFLFYMGTNGNQAMSTNSAVFHIFLFLLISFALDDRVGIHASHGSAATATWEPTLEKK